MRALVLPLLVVVLLAGARGPTVGARGPTVGGPAVRFEAVDLYVDTGDEALAAYQLDLSAAAGDVRIVGIEGGDHAAFAEPPYYDAAAMQGDRVIIAAFSTAGRGALPTGRSRIATVHVRITGDRPAEYRATLGVSATVDGALIPAELILETGHQP